MPRFYVTVGPQSPDEHPAAPAPTWIIEAANEDAARDKAEVTYRRSNPTVGAVRVRVTRAP